MYVEQEALILQKQLAACFRALGIANKLRDGKRHKSRIMARANRLRGILSEIGG